MTNQELSELAVSAKDKAKANYSNFHVGAALLTKNGKVYQGANIENSSYSLTICAERTAVFQAVLEDENEFEAIAIASDAEQFCPPCGACRQVLLDLCGPELSVVMIDQKKNLKTIKLKELIPFSFGEDFLK